MLPQIGGMNATLPCLHKVIYNHFFQVYAVIFLKTIILNCTAWKEAIGSMSLISTKNNGIRFLLFCSRLLTSHFNWLSFSNKQHSLFRLFNPLYNYYIQNSDNCKERIFILSSDTDSELLITALCVNDPISYYTS